MKFTAPQQPLTKVVCLWRSQWVGRVMCVCELFDDVEVKKANIRHHDVEARFFESVHPEGSSVYEKAEVSKSITFIAENSSSRDLCIDVGCGTGFVTGFELPLYESILPLDISKQMLRVVRNRYGHSDRLSLVVCDAEFLPLRNEIADLVSVASVLHHLPKPFKAMPELFRVLKKDGFLYVAREPNARRLRRFFDFLDNAIIHKFVGFACRQYISVGDQYIQNAGTDALDYARADIHYLAGFSLGAFCDFLRERCFGVISAYSYHWVFSDSNRCWLQQLRARSNFVIAKFPLSKKLGRYLSIIARKLG